MKNVLRSILAAIVALTLLCSLASCFEKEHVHDYSEWGSDTKNHWKYCPDDEEIEEGSYESHADANLDGKCDKCNHEVPLPHVHNYSKWMYDAENHWKVCPEDNEKDADSVEAHIDDNNDGKCDKCEKVVVKESVSVETIEGVPTLVVKGPLTEEMAAVKCLKLHAEGNGAHKYWSNVSTLEGAYEFRAPLSDLPVEGTPWWWFHIYAYAEAEPADSAKPAAKIDLPRGAIAEDASWTYDGVKYSVIKDKDSTQLVIQPNPVPDFTVESITLEVIENKPYVVVKGNISDKIKCIKIHANGNGDASFYGDSATVTEGKFEARFDLTLAQEQLAQTPWLWFHIYTYVEAEPADQTKGFTKFDLARGDYLAVDKSIECENVKYTVQNQSQLVIQPKAVDRAAPVVENITVETVEGKPTLIVTGTMGKDIPCVKLHAGGNDKYHYYVDNTSTESEKFKFVMPFDTLGLEDTPWYFIHVYVYDTAEPEDNAVDTGRVDVKAEKYDSEVTFWEYNGVKYSVIEASKVWDCFVIQPTSLS